MSGCPYEGIGGLIDVPGEYERVLKAPSSNSRGETNILEAEGAARFSALFTQMYTFSVFTIWVKWSP